MTVDHSVDPVERVEPVEKVASNSFFTTKVIIKNRNEALEGAKKDRTGLIFWTDGSKLDQGHAAAALCWKDKPAGQWREKSVFLGKNKEVLDAELWAVSETLDIAKKRINIVNKLVTIFCDSQKAFKAIVLSLTYQGNRFLQGLIYQKAQELQQNGYPITFKWIPNHSGLIKNEKANQAARNRAEKSGRLTERWSSLVYVRSKVSEMRSNDVTKWRNTETEDRKTSRCGYNVPETKGGISVILDIAP